MVSPIKMIFKNFFKIEGSLILQFETEIVIDGIDNLDKDEELARKLDEALVYGRPDGFRNSTIKKRQVKNLIRDCVGDDEILVEKLYKIAESQSEY